MAPPVPWYTSPPPSSTAETREQRPPRSLNSCRTSAAEAPSASTEAPKTRPPDRTRGGSVAGVAVATLNTRGAPERKPSTPSPTWDTRTHTLSPRLLASTCFRGRCARTTGNWTNPPPRGITIVTVTVTVPGTTGSGERGCRRRVGAVCPVARLALTLHAG